MATNVWGQHKNLRGGLAKKMGECGAGVRRWQKITNIQVWLTFRHNIHAWPTVTIQLLGWQCLETVFAAFFYRGTDESCCVQERKGAHQFDLQRKCHGQAPLLEPGEFTGFHSTEPVDWHTRTPGSQATAGYYCQIHNFVDTWRIAFFQKMMIKKSARICKFW